MQSHDVVTANGALSHSTTGTSVLDFFGKGGALRASSEQEILSLFSKAYREDKTLALKALFYLADVRSGQGERRLFRLAYNWLAKNDAPVAKKLLKYIPEYTRWDNVLESLEGTPLEKDALTYVAKQLKADAKAETPSIFPKWCPSEQASSDVTRRLAFKLRTQLKMSPKAYRKLLSGLRKKVGIVETKMCAGEWKKIDFSAVPSRAALIYKKAFNNHAPDSYSKFLTKVEKGEATINSSVLYPYDLVKDVENKNGNDLRTIEAQWKALPDYLADNPYNGLAVVDTSGSMDSGTGSVRPIDVAVSLGIYFAERNVGAFNGYFIAFSNDAKLIDIGNGSLKQKVSKVLGNREVANTNLQSVFDLVLSKAIKSKVPQKEMPAVLILISDMEFDTAVTDNSKTNLEVIREKYKNAGYKMPDIVFWNVNASSQVPVKMSDKGVALVSGCSPSILKTVFGRKIVTPYDLMMETLQSERYKVIEV